MNLAELIIFTFAFLFGGLSARVGYDLFGVWGLVGGGILGLALGALIASGLLAMTLWISSRRNKQRRNSNRDTT